MSNIRVEQYQPQSSQDIARQRLVASRQELRLYTHLLQASFVVERDNPLRRIVAEHRQLIRNLMVAIVISSSIIVGALAPQIARLLGII